jgi:aspartyl-tRNA(Asn)/glutamyl-tRNA(Gln) amidotransferase subunit A
MSAGGAKFTRVFAFTGQPAMTIPAGLDGDGLPIGITLTTRCRREDLLFRAGYAFQQTTDHHGLRPPLL